ncbi:hypothetical protein YTPLAS18_18020 [Nitrospira sp.]|nr:hypothetical protein YTPLAS18_18020 [Nitrospira sp.]
MSQTCSGGCIVVQTGSSLGLLLARFDDECTLILCGEEVQALRSCEIKKAHCAVHPSGWFWWTEHDAPRCALCERPSAEWFADTWGRASEAAVKPGWLSTAKEQRWARYLLDHALSRGNGKVWELLRYLADSPSWPDLILRWRERHPSARGFE